MSLVYVKQDRVDAALTDIANRANALVLCSALPANYTEANVTYALASAVLVTGIGNGDYSLGAGAGTDRRLTIAERDVAAAAASGTVTHAALIDTVNQSLEAVLEYAPADQVAAVAGRPLTVSEIQIDMGIRAE